MNIYTVSREKFVPDSLHGAKFVNISPNESLTEEDLHDKYPFLKDVVRNMLALEVHLLKMYNRETGEFMTIEMIK